MFDSIRAVAEKYGCDWKENAPMREYTSFKTGGPAQFLVMPNSVEALQEILIQCNQEKIKPYIIGNGSNLLVSDKGLRGVVIRITSAMSQIKDLGNGLVRCETGASLSKLCTFALNHALSGLEFAYGIPGTAGGAAYMNAGAYGGEMKDVLVKCEHLDKSGNPGEFTAEELDLQYRHSVYSDKDYVITAITLQLDNADPIAIKDAMADKMARRKDKQPLEFPSAGSTFKRPEGYFAGALIEECGLKGKNIGGAEVSEKHAGFIINRGGASTQDILDLIHFVQDTVRTQKGVQLETEVKFVE